ncbi:MAG: hypothetical protein Q6K95_02040 [Gloeomargarita sp. GXS_bins_116]
MTVKGLTIRLLNTGRRLYGWGRKLTGVQPTLSLPVVDYTGQAASDVIQDQIAALEPCMIARFGGVELGALAHYYWIHKKTTFPGQKSWGYITGRGGPFWWDDNIKKKMRYNAGFFPAEPAYLERFCERMLQDMPLIDVLGSWLPDERLFSPLIRQAVKVKLEDLEPYYHERPWSKALRGKTVLVVHPFADTIWQQYRKRELLFQNPDVLPEFELKTFKAVQSIAGNDCGFPDWFAALDWMAEQIAQMDFDIALIGAGAYGLPLAAHVKRLGKKAVHLGGATQILFGIKGKRWDERPFFQRLYNEYWVRPAPHEVPPKADIVESGCYW